MSIANDLERWWEAEDCTDEIWEIIENVRDLERTKNGAYSERNKLVALLSAIYPSSRERHPDSDTAWDDGWRWIIFIDLPTGQASWHIHDSELPLFQHIPCNQGRVWDGHSTEQKYERVDELKAKLAANRTRLERDKTAGGSY